MCFEAAKTTLIAGGVPRGELPYKRSLAIWEKTLGPDHPMLGTSLNDLAELYRDQGSLPRGRAAPQAQPRQNRQSQWRWRSRLASSVRKRCLPRDQRQHSGQDGTPGANCDFWDDVPMLWPRL